MDLSFAFWICPVGKKQWCLILKDMFKKCVCTCKLKIRKQIHVASKHVYIHFIKIDIYICVCVEQVHMCRILLYMLQKLLKQHLGQVEVLVQVTL